MKIKNKGKIYPSPSSSSSSASCDADFLWVLKLLPTAILALASALSIQDREVLAYMITRSTKPTAPFPITPTKKKPSKKSSSSSATHNHKPPVFDCDCFDCYTSYWVRWDSSPNRELIHQVIESFEDHLAHGENNSKKVNGGRGKRRDRLNRRVPVVPVPEIPDLEALHEEPQQEQEEEKSSGVLIVEEEKADVAVEGNVEVAVMKVEEEMVAGADVAVRTMVAATCSNSHKGLARKVLPDVVGLLNSRWCSFWSPKV